MLTEFSKLIACVHQRLKAVYTHYLYLEQTATATNTLPPHTIPAYNAPGKRFIIIRADKPSPLISAFDSSMSNATYRRALLLEQMCSPDFSAGNSDEIIEHNRPKSSSTDSDLEDSPKRWTGGGLLRSIINPSKHHSRSKSQSPSRLGERDPPIVSRAPTSTPEPRSRIESLSDSFGSGVGAYDAFLSWKRQQSSIFRPYCFRFALEAIDRRAPPPTAMVLHTPRLPQPAHTLLMRYLRGMAMEATGSAGSASETSTTTDDAASGRTSASHFSDDRGTEESGEDGRPSGIWLPPVVGARRSETRAARELGRYTGRALAEWALVINECHLFFEKRRADGIPGNRYVETPLLGTADTARGLRG
jgi:hypothetical protein